MSPAPAGNKPMQDPLISVIIPARGAASQVRECVEALLAQSYAKRELLVVCPADEAPELPEDSPEVKLIRAKPDEGVPAMANRGLRAAEGEVRVLLMPNCVPADAHWLERLSRSFGEKQTAVVVSRVRVENKRALPLAARAFACIAPPELKGESSKPTELELVSHLCDAYRADVLENVGYLAAGGMPSPGEAVDVSVKIVKAGGHIVLSPDAVVTYQAPPDLATAGGMLAKALDYGHADAVLGKLHNVDWLASRVFTAALLSLALVPIGLVRLPVGVVLAGLMFLWGWFLPLRLPLLRWEWPVAVLNLAAYVAVIVTIRGDWLRSVFDPYEWHPAIIRQWCILAAMTGSYVLLVLGASARRTLHGALKGYVRGPLSALAAFVLITIWQILSGIGFAKGYVLSRATHSGSR